jgi:hypothetical protein
MVIASDTLTLKNLIHGQEQQKEKEKRNRENSVTVTVGPQSSPSVLN